MRRVATRTLDTFELDGRPRISTGNDSHVYLLGDQIAKEYQRLTIEEVERYADLQNRAVGILASSPYRTSFPVAGRSTRLEARAVVPIQELAMSATGLPVTLSRFIAGPNLEKIMYRPEAFNAWADRELPNDSLREFGAQLNELFWTEYPTRVQDEFHYHVSMLSRFLGDRLGIAHAYISKYNVKVLPADDGIELVVTDLALYIDRLVFR